MTIHSVVSPCEKTSFNISQGSPNNIKPSPVPARQLVKIDFSTEGSICSNLTIKHGKVKKKIDYKSPYIDGEGVHMISRVTEKRFVHKKSANIVSSFPLAANLYKANSDEFKAIKKNKKVQKSVLTLPNDPSPTPQICTVSDMNDSEYLNRHGDNRKKNKKRAPPVYKRKLRTHGKDSNFYNRDARYSSKIDINLDYSSTDTEGEGKRKSSLTIGSNKKKTQPHDVWAVLRNMNRFQFRPSPPVSEDSFISPKKIKRPQRRNNRKDNNMRVVKKCCIEEFAYISSYDVDNKSSCGLSKSSVSFDKITVIDKEDGYNKREIREGITKNNQRGTFLDTCKANNKSAAKNKALPVKADNFKALSHSESTFPNREDKMTPASNIIDNNIYESSIIDNFKDTSNTHSPQPSQSSEFTFSVHSGSSKSLLKQTTSNNRRDINKPVKVTLDTKFNGITKVILSKGKNVEQPTKPLKIHSRQITTLPSNPVIIPKLRVTEIRRRMSNIKYPVVILEKDQLSSTVRVMKQKPSQFDGLDKQMWPYMQKWYDIDFNENALKTQNKTKQTEGSVRKKIISKQVDVGNLFQKKINGPKQSKLKFGNDLTYNSTKTDHKRVHVPSGDLIKESQEQTKLKPILQFRDRMMKLLYKNSTPSAFDGSRKENSVIPENVHANTIDARTDIKISRVDTKPTTKDTEVNLILKGSKAKVSPTKFSQVRVSSWTKGKWASDFIDNVIKKIKTGVYYTLDNKISNLICSHETKDVEIQTIPTFDVNLNESAQSISTISTSNYDLPIIIPGFDDTLPAIEIKTMNMNEISIKHCVTNIMVHFDVTVPQKPIIVSENDTSFLIPVDTTNESYNKTFKCKTSILNAMLPAELCSILPQMFRKIEREQVILPIMPVEKTSNLSIISEVTRCDSPTDVQKTHPTLPLFTPISQELWRLLKGRYINMDQMFPKFHILGKTSLLVNYEQRIVEELMPHLSRASLFGSKVDLTLPRMLRVPKSSTTPSVTSIDQINTCTVLNRYYQAPNLFCELFNKSSILNKDGTILPMIHSLILSNTNSINVEMKQSFQITLSVGNFKMEFLFNGCLNIVNVFKNNFFTNTNPRSPCKCVEYVDIYRTPSHSVEYVNAERTSRCVEYMNISSNNNQQNSLQSYASVRNTRRKGFVKLYKKFKSNSKTSEEKVTRLSKITNLNDFFQALGFKKYLASVFDDQSGRKIMSSIQEMKNWTSEINPKQALLVLLLANKKDSSNLLRYRSVILQGIAVNRITKSNELDMEIEVIERENLNRLSKYEGITYLPASIENQDSLFEELCWIAKTTASDYQRPFDESSEKLLKSLLQKRKKLNPSYLRVVARYVGLGLLKSPGKK